jgi:hypothetical protein
MALKENGSFGIDRLNHRPPRSAETIRAMVISSVPSTLPSARRAMGLPSRTDGTYELITVTLWLDQNTPRLGRSSRHVLPTAWA